jgi:hypothetical protein
MIYSCCAPASPLLIYVTAAILLYLHVFIHTVSGINGKNSAMGFFFDHKSSPAGSIPVSPNRHGTNQSKNQPTLRRDEERWSMRAWRVAAEGSW